jgi:hypothetical protein
MGFGVKKPNNAILVGGSPLVAEAKITTVTSMYAGRLVKKGTNDGDIVVNTAAGDAIGWLGYEQLRNSGYLPETVDTIYVVNAIAPVLYGGGFVVVGRLAQGQNVAAGARLVAAASGELTVAIAAIATTGASTASAVDATTPHISGSVGAQGMIVAIAMESVDASSAAQDIMVQSLI